MAYVARHEVLSPFQVIFLLSICILISNTAALSLDSLHSSMTSEDDSFKTALQNIHYRRNMAEKRRQPFHYESKFSKKDSHKLNDQEEDEDSRKYYQSYASEMYAPSFSRNVERFLSEIGDEDGEEKKDRNIYEIKHEEELKPDRLLIKESRRKKTLHDRPYHTDTDGPSRIFAHKSSAITDSIHEHTPKIESEEEIQPDGLISRRKKGRSNLLNYPRGTEHYSRFWDPERRAANRFQRKRMHGISNEIPTAFENRKRYSKRRPYQNQSLLKSHTNIKRSKDSKERVMGELNEILKDEDEEKRDVKKRENDKEEKIKETKLDNSSDIQVNEPLAENTIVESSVKSEKEDGDKFNEWLRDEYFKTMAMTMATMKKKRGTWAPVISADLEGSNVPKQQLRIAEDFEDEKAQRFQAIEERLESIEKAMLSDALQLIREDAEERGGSEAYGEQVLSKLYAANDVQKMREALEHLRQSMDHMRQYQDQEYQEEGSVEDDEGISNWPNISPIKREENLAKALRVMAPSQSKRQYSTPNGAEQYLPRVSMRSLSPFVPDDGSSGPLVSIYNSPSEDSVNVDTTEDNDCPALDLLSSDCSVLGDIVPSGPLNRLVLEACNWHEVCYSCGGSFGLSADECDVGFVEQSRTICQDNIPCQTTARMMLMPLRQRRVFFKRSVPAICYREPCVERFLQRG